MELDYEEMTEEMLREMGADMEGPFGARGELYLYQHLGFLQLVVNPHYGYRLGDEGYELRQRGYIDILRAGPAPDTALVQDFDLAALPGTLPWATRLAVQWDIWQRGFIASPVNATPISALPTEAYNALSDAVRTPVLGSDGEIVYAHLPKTIYEVMNDLPETSSDALCFHEAFDALLQSNLAAIEIASAHCASFMQGQPP